MTSQHDASTVVVLHGLGRTAFSMRPIERALAREGFDVVNFGYASRRGSVAASAAALAERLTQTPLDGQARVHFVVHSLGGIVVRKYAAEYGSDRIARVVMLATPNQGAEVVDRFREQIFFTWVMGPAARELGTAVTDLPNALGPLGFEAGVIAGNRSINPFFSRMIPGENDGTVAVERTKVPGMRDFLVVPYNHTFLMNAPEVQRQAVYFLRNGRFLHQG